MKSSILRECDLFPAAYDVYPAYISLLFSCQEQLLLDNCYAIDLSNQRIKVNISSPFVAATCGLIIRRIFSEATATACLDKLHLYMQGHFNTDGLINFFDQFDKNYDIDTLAMASLFLLYEGSDSIDKQRILDIIRRNKCNTDDINNGAYWTWIDRERNNVDYYVNINIYVLLRSLGFLDKSLIEYLRINSNNFFKYGSHYYRNIEFPLFMIMFYWHHGYVNKDDEVFAEIISKILSTDFLYEALCYIFGVSVNSEYARANGGSRFTEYFRSSSKSFHSPILDTIIETYLDCHRQEYYSILHNGKLPVECLK